MTFQITDIPRLLPELMLLALALLVLGTDVLERWGSDEQSQLERGKAAGQLTAIGLVFVLIVALVQSKYLFTIPELAPDTNPVLAYLISLGRNLQAGGLLGDGRHVPIGYVPQLTRIESASIQDIDVLFYGSMNTRREAVLRKLGNRGLKVIHAFNAYGARRDALIARAKVVLNVHYYDSKIFEMVRVSYLLANRKAVVSEVGPDTDLEPELSSAVAAASYDGLVDAATELVRDESRRRVLEVNAFETFSARPQVRWLAPALAALPWFVSATGNAAVDPDAAHAASAGRVR